MSREVSALFQHTIHVMSKKGLFKSIKVIAFCKNILIFMKEKD